MLLLRILFSVLCMLLISTNQASAQQYGNVEQCINDLIQLQRKVHRLGALVGPPSSWDPFAVGGTDYSYYIRNPDRCYENVNKLIGYIAELEARMPSSGPSDQSISEGMQSPTGPREAPYRGEGGQGGIPIPPNDGRYESCLRFVQQLRNESISLGMRLGMGNGDAYDLTFANPRGNIPTLDRCEWYVRQYQQSIVSKRDMLKKGRPR